jgi:hypothetical protein
MSADALLREGGILSKEPTKKRKNKKQLLFFLNFLLYSSQDGNHQ